MQRTGDYCHSSPQWSPQGSPCLSSLSLIICLSNIVFPLTSFLTFGASSTLPQISHKSYLNTLLSFPFSLCWFFFSTFSNFPFTSWSLCLQCSSIFHIEFSPTCYVMVGSFPPLTFFVCIVADRMSGLNVDISKTWAQHRTFQGAKF